MNRPSAGAESVVRHHLRTFLQGHGVDVIVSDYGDGARLLTEERVFAGKSEIRSFFQQFLQALPPGATDRFKLKSLRVDGKMAFITWCVEGDILLGTDTFVVEDGRIVSQTFAMQAASVPAGADAADHIESRR